MATEIIMPKVDMVMESGTFVEWLRKEGEHVEKGQPLFVIMTDKAAIEIEAPASGILSDVKAKADDVIPVTQTIAYILDPGEELPSVTHQNDLGGNEGKLHTDAISSAPVMSAIAVASSPLGPGKVRATPVARRMAAQLGVDLMALRGDRKSVV